ncbi:MAG TPA: hypothetical protein VMY78_13420 [Solirubrobacteraceae bacterium]|nr:hypothetical protein [Solirubrobacteraceae bacterium]
MSKRQRKTRTTSVFLPELGRKVTVRGPTEGELAKRTGEDTSTPEAIARVAKRVVGTVVVSPRLTTRQVESLSDESVELICKTNLLLHPVTAAMRASAQRVASTGGADMLRTEMG